MKNDVAQKAGWQVELWMNALGTIENIAMANGYDDDMLSSTAIASVLAAVVDEAYSIGLCIGAVSKEEQVDRHCFRNQN